MDYKEAVDFLFSRLPAFQKDGIVAYKPGLRNIRKLCTALGNPQESFLTIHVAGTNGKGSVASMLAAILNAAGYRTGLFTSPHLRGFNERIRVNGKPINEEKVAAFVRRYKGLINEISPSFFEVTTAMAFDHFANERADIAIIETGIGGTFDSTNIIDPELSVITNISWDHKDILGDTLDLITWEKAGIIKPGVPVVIGATTPASRNIFLRKAKQTSSPIYLPENFLR